MLPGETGDNGATGGTGGGAGGAGTAPAAADAIGLAAADIQGAAAPDIPPTAAVCDTTPDIGVTPAAGAAAEDAAPPDGAVWLEAVAGDASGAVDCAGTGAAEDAGELDVAAAGADVDDE